MDRKTDQLGGTDDIPQVYEGPSMNRRAMMVTSAIGALFGMSKPTEGAEKKSDNNERSPYEPTDEMREANEAVEAAGFLTINHAIDVENPKDRTARQLTILKPNRFALGPVSITTKVTTNGSGVVLLPCPRDALDQMNAGTKVTVTSPNGREVKHSAKIMYSNNPDGKGFENPFVEITIEDPDFKGVCLVRAQHWIMLPQYQPVEPAALARSIATRMFGDQATPVKEAMQAAYSITYDATVGVENLEWALEHKRGDCGVRAAAAARAGNKANKVNIAKAGNEILVYEVEGYSFKFGRHDEEFGGKHACNMVDSKLGSFMFDARTPEMSYVGPQSGFIIAMLGDHDDLDTWGTIKACNGGYYRDLQQFELANMSLPGFGVDKEYLAALTPPREIEKNAKALEEWRLNLYSADVNPRVLRFRPTATKNRRLSGN